MIIKSLLDTDFYKLTMQQVVLHQFPSTQVEYAFKCRSKANWTREIVDEINNEIDELCKLTFNHNELEYLSGIRFLKPDYIDFLRLMKLNRENIIAYLDEGNLRIRIIGSWLLTILFEVPVLAIVNEVYNKHTYPKPDLNGAVKRLEDKISKFPGRAKVSDFGTRRRFSATWQMGIVSTLKSKLGTIFTGSSNVHLSKMFGTVPIGTMAHEFIQCGQNIGVRLIDSQKRMLQAWVDEYRGDLGIALTDTLGINAFLVDFDKYFAKLYDGVRHDSGDPFVWANLVLDHYRKLGIDPRTKTLVFSDSLDVDKVVAIDRAFGLDAKLAYGIGTNFTNDIPGVEPLNIVIKVVKCNGKPVAKISDSPGKGMCEDGEYIHYLKKVFEIEEE
jgi:nicotinate phosphoribosyltransferase